jgi:hypothetical protein
VRATAQSGPLLESRAERVAALCLGAYLLAFVVYAIVAERGLVADGANYVVNMAIKHGFTFEEPGRRAAEILYQWPAVVAVRLGVTDLLLLGRLYAVGCFYLVFLSLIASWALLPAARKKLIFFPVLTILIGWLTSCYASMVEAHALVLWFWPVMFALLFHRLARRRDVVLVSALSLPMMVLYPTVVLLAPALAGVAFWRWRARPADRQGWAWIALAIWFVLVTAVALYLIVEPRDVPNRDSLLNEVEALAFLAARGQGVNWPLALALAAMPLLLLCAWRPTAARCWILLWLPPYLVLALFTALAPIVALSSFAPNLQHAARAWEGLAAALLLPPLFAHLAGRLSLAGPGRRPALLVLAILAVGQITWQVATTAQWSGRLAMLAAVLASRSGLIPIEETPLVARRIGLQAVTPLGWAWTDPLLSIVLAPGGKVAAIVTAPKPIGWQPFDPAHPDELPRVPGIDYTRYREALARDRPAAATP